MISIIKDTDLEQTFECRLGLLEEVLWDSNTDLELITNYSKRYKREVEKGSLRTFCSLDLEKFVLSLALGYECHQDYSEKIDLKKTEEIDYMLYLAVDTAIEKINKSGKVEKVADKTYRLLKPNLREYKLRYKLVEVDIGEESLASHNSSEDDSQVY